MKIFYGFFAMLSCNIYAAQGIYQWTNEEGVAEFSEKPPPAGIEFTILPIDSLPSELNEFQSLELEKAIKDEEKITSVVLHGDPSGHYLSSGTINGMPVEFLLDTGATMVSIPAHVAQSIGLLQEGFVRLNTANGIITAFTTVLETISLDAIVLHGIGATIYDDPHNDRILLGMSFLKEVEFTQKDNLLTLRQRKKPE
jgi:aspartyl protease family protein